MVSDWAKEIVDIPSGLHARVQVLDANGVKAPCEVRRELVQRVRADGGDTGMQPRQSGLGFAAVGRSLDLARQAPGEPAQSVQQRLVGLRTGDRLSRRERCQCRHAQIDTRRALVFGWGQVRTLGREMTVAAAN